jgi:hypothetical protein
MIVFVTSRGHEYTVASLARGTFGFEVPDIEVISYERLLRSRRIDRATYVFTDMERLSPWELRAAADLFRALSNAGLRCLNDPARVKSRVELLRALHSAGLNPFNVYRADEQPQPDRFPVFLRFEADHGWPLSELLEDRAALDFALDALRRNGTPLRGVIAVEHCPAPYVEGRWHKWGTFRAGAAMSVDHISVDDKWLVKNGDWDKLSDEVIADEHDAVSSNRFAADLQKAFDIAGIDFGRAHHATVGGKTVVYEINTNPNIGRYVPDPKPLRRQTQAIARMRLAEALKAIDSEIGCKVAIEATPLLRKFRRWRFGFLFPKRP